MPTPTKRVTYYTLTKLEIEELILAVIPRTDGKSQAEVSWDSNGSVEVEVFEDFE